MSTSRTDSFNQVEEQWFYADSNRAPQGPFSFPDLQRLKAEGIITLETLVIAQGAEEWVPYARVAPLPKLPPFSQPSPLQGDPPQLGDQLKVAQNAILAAIEACSRRKWVVVLSLFLFCPLGLVFLWRSGSFNNQTKKIVTAIAAPLYLLLLISNTPATAAAYYLSLGFVLLMIWLIEKWLVETLWFYMDSNQNSIGPVTSGAIFKLVMKREVSYGTLVLPEGGDHWVPLSKARFFQRKRLISTEIDWSARSAVILSLVFFAPLGIVLLWRSPKFGLAGRSFLSLATCIIIWPIFVVITFAILTDDGKHHRPQPSTRAVASTPTAPTQAVVPQSSVPPSSGAAATKTLGLTVEEFRTAFNTKAVQTEADSFQIPPVEIEEGAVKNMFSFKYSSKLMLQGFVDKETNQLVELVIMGYTSDTETALSFSFLSIMVIETLDPTIQPGHGYEVVMRLQEGAEKMKEELQVAHKGRLKLSALNAPKLGGSMFFISKSKEQE